MSYRTRLYILLFSCALIILLASLEVVVTVKDPDVFEAWKQSAVGVPQDAAGPERAENALSTVFLTSALLAYVSKIALPIALALYVALLFKKPKLTPLFIYVWCALCIGGAAYALLSRTFFYIPVVGGYGIILLTLMSFTMRRDDGHIDSRKGE